MTQKRVSQLETVQKEALELFTRKNTDYGDAFANYGTIGVIVRLGDKISRLQNIEKNYSSYLLIYANIHLITYILDSFIGSVDYYIISIRW